MDNEKDNLRGRDSKGSLDGKRKIVLGEEEFPKSVVERGSMSNAGSNEHQGIKTQDDSTGVADENESRGFFRKFLNRQPDEMEPIEGARINRSPLFDEEMDSVLAEESTRQAPMQLLGEDDSTETSAARLIREKDYAAMETDAPILSKGSTDLERRNRRVKNGFIGGAVFAVIALLLFFFAPNLQEMIFKTTDNSLIFNSATGIFGPRAGILQILLGVLGIVLIFSTLFKKRKEESLSKKQAQENKSNPIRTLGLIMLIFIPLGFASLFNFTEFRNDNIRFSSLFNQNKEATYNQVMKQTIHNRGNEIYYTLQLNEGPETTLNITDFPVESIRLLDLKLPVERNVSISTEVIDKLVEQKIYTRDEALRLFINK